VCLAVLFGLFCVPALFHGAHLLVCWFRIHTSEVYYTDYPYLAVGFIFSSVGFLGAFATWFGVSRKSFYGLLFLVPVSQGLAAMILIPCMEPRAPSATADANYLSEVRPFFRLWYEENHLFPGNEAEFREAFAKGRAAWGNGAEPVPASAYRKGGKPLSYEIVVETNATGPRLRNLSERPAVVYYCVSEDRQEYWVTMTALESEFGPASSLVRTGGPNGEARIAHAAGSDYSAESE